MLESSLSRFGKSWQDELCNLDVKDAFLINSGYMVLIHLLIIYEDDLLNLWVNLRVFKEDQAILLRENVVGQV